MIETNGQRAVSVDNRTEYVVWIFLFIRLILGPRERV